MFGVCMCLFCVCIVLCLDRGFATRWSLIQGVLPSVKMIMKLIEEARAQGGCRASEKKYMYVCSSELEWAPQTLLASKNSILTPKISTNIITSFVTTCKYLTLSLPNNLKLPILNTQLLSMNFSIENNNIFKVTFIFTWHLMVYIIHSWNRVFR
jgi:hypothetical protein